jgi:hypothetical protein
MRSSTFNFLVAIFCASFAAFGNQTPWIVGLNLGLAMLNLWIGIVQYKRGA